MKRLALLAVATLILDLVLIQPNHPGAMTWDALRLFPLELPVILLLLIALPQRGVLSRGARLVLSLGLTAIALLKVADFAMFTALNRGFNPATDLHLVQAAWRLGSGTLGAAGASAVVLGALLASAAVAGLLVWSMSQWTAVEPSRRSLRGAAATGSLCMAMLAGAQVGNSMNGWKLPFDPPGDAFTARVGLERLSMLRQARSDMREFRRISALDPFAGARTLFDRLGGRDVQIVFVESYGHTSFANPLYRPTHAATLRRAEGRLAEAGLAMRSGWLTSPITGGQSWLAHGSLASGLRTGSQGRYGAMLASPRLTLFDLARDAGYRTVAVMPAITLPWPEGTLMGFDTLLTAPDLGYRGKPFNWITMPDQYTYAAWRGLVPRDRPLFTQIATVSSHAPWVPVPEMIPWEEVGDGTAFDRWAESGDPPSVVWKDSDRIREQYRRAIDYALQAVMAEAARQADDPPLMVVLGDHQPAEFVAQDASRDVPVHLIGPPDLIALFDGWLWTPGLIPGAVAPVPMEAFRDRFIRAVTSRSLGGDAS